MKQINLTQGKIALVDDSDYAWLSLTPWYYSGSGYAARDFTRNKEKISVYMHRLILNVADDKEVDHIDGNRLNNTRSNLRICSRAENALNIRKRKNASSKYKGVYWDEAREQFRVAVNSATYGEYYVGSFYSEDEAGLAYNLAAGSLHGDFACLNDIPSNICLPFKTKVEPSRSSKYKGVSFDKRGTNKWYAYIDHDHKRVWCKRFNSEEEAFKTRQSKLEELGLT